MRYRQGQESSEGESRAKNQWEIAQRNLSAQQWQDMSTLNKSRFEPAAAQQTVDRLFPSYSEIFGSDMRSSPSLSNEEVARQVNSFVRSLPNEPKALTGKLDRLFRQNAEALSDAGSSARASSAIPSNGSMPPLAPQRPGFGQITEDVHNAPPPEVLEAKPWHRLESPEAGSIMFPKRNVKF